jgi:PTS system ascorbate-specific IIA component
MSVGVLLVTHDQFGQSLLDVAVQTLGSCPLPVAVMSVNRSCDPDRMIFEAKRRLEVLNSGEGVLVLTDMFGSTPSNIACKLRMPDSVVVVSGINLPMLLRVLNYPNLSLRELQEKAVSGGREGIMDCSLLPH